MDDTAKSLGKICKCNQFRVLLVKHRMNMVQFHEPSEARFLAKNVLGGKRISFKGFRCFSNELQTLLDVGMVLGKGTFDVFTVNLN